MTTTADQDRRERGPVESPRGTPARRAQAQRAGDSKQIPNAECRLVSLPLILSEAIRFGKWREQALCDLRRATMARNDGAVILARALRDCARDSAKFARDAWGELASCLGCDPRSISIRTFHEIAERRAA